MPRARIGSEPMSAAQRQARRRVRLRDETAVPAITPPQRRPASRPQRWAAAVDTLIDLQAHYQNWLDTLPDGLHSTVLAERLEAITELDLQTLQEIELPRGYGRD